MTHQVGSGFPDIQTVGQNTGSTTTLSVTSNVSANTKGTWQQLTASTPFDADSFWVHLSTKGGSNTHHFLVDLSIDGTNALITNMWVPSQGSFSWPIPIALPSGTGIWLRCQDEAGGNSVLASVTLLGEDFSLLSNLPLAECLFDTADTTISNGKIIAPNGSANVMSGWTELVSSTSAVCRKLLINCTSPNSSNGEQLVEIGIGGSGSEAVLIPQMYFQTPDFGSERSHIGRFFDVDIPAGSRLSVRHQSQRTDSDGNLRINVHGFG